MATQKRRVIYVSDEEWTQYQDWAKTAGRSTSEWIRDMLDYAMGETYVRPDVKHTKVPIDEYFAKRAAGEPDHAIAAAWSRSQPAPKKR